MAASAQYASTPKNYGAALSTANTGLTGATGTFGTVYTAGVTGARIDAIQIQATATTTAGMIRFFISIDGGTTKRLIGEVPVTAKTPSATVSAFSSLVTNTSGFLLKGLVLQANAILYATTEKAESFHVTALVAGDF